MNNNLICEHTWNKTDDALFDEMIRWHSEGTAPKEQRYISKYTVHYWDILKCSDCGAKRLFSGVFDKDNIEAISDEEFLWLSIFINQLNEEIGYIEEKKNLINEALDQMHWQYFPYVSLHTPENDYFSISYKNNNFLRYNWDFYDAANLFRKMNLKAVEYLYPISAEKLADKMQDLDVLKSKYITLMEIATQSGMDASIKREIDKLYNAFNKLSNEIEDLIAHK